MSDLDLLKKMEYFEVKRKNMEEIVFEGNIEDFNKLSIEELEELSVLHLS